ncbi:YbjQ family protein [Paracoccus tegillarcae]|nr:YbjQ family protein [Paracoccus tegillarcae]
MGFFGKVGDSCSQCKSAQLVGESDETISGPNETNSEINNIILTTECGTNLEIFERIEIVTAECAYGMNIFRDLFTSARDIVGGRSKAIQNTMRDARRMALLELKREAHAVGANAVVGVDLDYVELSGAGNMVMLVASGTAVRAKL